MSRFVITTKFKAGQQVAESPPLLHVSRLHPPAKTGGNKERPPKKLGEPSTNKAFQNQHNITIKQHVEGGCCHSASAGELAPGMWWASRCSRYTVLIGTSLFAENTWLTWPIGAGMYKIPAEKKKKKKKSVWAGSLIGLLYRELPPLKVSKMQHLAVDDEQISQCFRLVTLTPAMFQIPYFQTLIHCCGSVLNPPNSAAPFLMRPRCTSSLPPLKDMCSG